MRDCKIIHIGYTDQIRDSQRTVKANPDWRPDILGVMDHPALEKEVNKYLSQGYRIVNAYHDDGMWFILEREQ